MIELITTLYNTVQDQIINTLIDNSNNQNSYLNHLYSLHLYLHGSRLALMTNFHNFLNTSCSTEKCISVLKVFLIDTHQENNALAVIEHKDSINYVMKYTPKNYFWETWETFTYSINKLNTNSATTVFTSKLTFCILILILIRGGVPRYRYDYLTKIGWIRFLAWTLTVFLIVLLSTLVF